MARDSGESESTIIGEALDCLILRQRVRMEAWNAERAFIERWRAKGLFREFGRVRVAKTLHDRKGLAETNSLT